MCIVYLIDAAYTKNFIHQLTLSVAADKTSELHTVNVTTNANNRSIFIYIELSIVCDALVFCFFFFLNKLELSTPADAKENRTDRVDSTK